MKKKHNLQALRKNTSFFSNHWKQTRQFSEMIVDSKPFMCVEVGILVE